MAPAPAPAPPSRRRILFLDAYDSFSNNITSLLTTLLDVDVHVLLIDSPLFSESLDRLHRELAHYDALVCGPGPGSPTNDADVGLIRRVWTLPHTATLPVLGVCLGFQSLVVAAGANVRRLKQGLHGMVRRIDHQGDDVFAGMGEFCATLYHSLCGDLGQDAIAEEEWNTAKWQPFEACPDLVPLAWVEEDRDGGVAERVLMAVKHRNRPFWGVQYHPESVCTEKEGDKLIVNWFREALKWNKEMGRVVDDGNDILAGQATRQSLLSQISSKQSAVGTQEHQQDHATSKSSADTTVNWRSHGVGFQLSTRTVPLPLSANIIDMVESLGQVTGREQIVLDSANASTGGAADIRGRYSIVALDVPEALRLEHHVGDGHLTAILPHARNTNGNSLPSADKIKLQREETISLDGYTSVWHFLSEFHDARRLQPTHDTPDSPFFGGFMGFITYEQGLSDIDVDFPRDRGHHRPDICFAWVTRSLVIDHAQQAVHVQHLHPPGVNGQAWLDSTVNTLLGSFKWRQFSDGKTRRLSRSDHPIPRLFDVTSFTMPAVDVYENKVATCQEYIAAGESYELCLTDQTVIKRPSADTGAAAIPQPLEDITTATISPAKRRRSSLKNSPGTSWQLFRTLRARQPAPFASYVRLGGATLVGSSPERFLAYNNDGLCSMRPMKGTVRKSPACPTLHEAERILHVPKEEAENLMIVDLVRHDLHGICGAGNVTARDLMRVEEYRSVFQMTTVVEGQLPRGGSGHTGLDVLAASLPPGSMTGAPKKRSCEILLDIEGGKERSLYSGVVGYMCASGRGDWSVTIRSMFRWDDETRRVAGEDGAVAEEETWRIGAGGAVTILSTPEGEREEMFTKLAGPMGIFSSPE